MTLQLGRTTSSLIVRSVHPLNAETPQHLLCRSPLTPSAAYFVRNHGDIPSIDDSRFRLAVGGDVATPLVLSVADLRERFEVATLTATVACAGNRRSEIQPLPEGIPWQAGAIGTAAWTGVRLRDVLLAAGAASGGRHVAFTGADDCDGEGFGASIPLDKALSPEVLLAFAMNGSPLAPEHGHPLRAVVPGWIGARSVKWLTAITVQDEPSTSFYQREDYTIDGWQLSELPLTSAVCRTADDGSSVRVEGYAMGAAGRCVTRVEVSCDGGRTWCPAVLDGPADPWTWRLWHADVTVPPDATDIVVRAVDDTGRCQPEHVSWTANPRGYLYNAWPRQPLD